MANETTSYYWEKHGGNILLNSIGIRTNTLTLTNVQLQDAGSYRCVAFFCSICRRTASNYATVTVKGKIIIVYSFIYIFICSCTFNICVTSNFTVC